MTTAIQRIITWRWQEPSEGSSAAVWSMMPGEWKEIQKAIDWVNKYWEDRGEEGEVGSTIVATEIHETKVKDHDCDDIQEALVELANSVRYSSGEELYTEDCPVFLKNGIPRC
jgi:hypothetical protein